MRLSTTVGKIHRKTPVPESFLRKYSLSTGVFKNSPLAQTFSCEFGEISKNTFFKEYLWTTASVGSSSGW